MSSGKRAFGAGRYTSLEYTRELQGRPSLIRLPKTEAANLPRLELVLGVERFWRRRVERAGNHTPMRLR